MRTTLGLRLNKIPFLWRLSNALGPRLALLAFRLLFGWAGEQFVSPRPRLPRSPETRCH